jgi:hypothetical protein
MEPQEPVERARTAPVDDDALEEYARAHRIAAE